MRPRDERLAWALPVLRGLEFLFCPKGNSAPQSGRTPRELAFPRGRSGGGSDRSFLSGHPESTQRTHPYKRTGPRPGWRFGPRFPYPFRRRPGHREIHPGAFHCREPKEGGSPLCHRRRECRAGRGKKPPLRTPKSIHPACHHDESFGHRSLVGRTPPRACGHRLHPDGIRG